MSERTEALSIGCVIGGSTPANRGWQDSIKDPTERVAAAAAEVDAPVSLNVVFHIPGNLASPEFEGVRTGRFSKDQSLLMVQVALPEAAAPYAAEFLREAVRRAIAEAARWAEKRRLKSTFRSLKPSLPGVETVAQQLAHRKCGCGNGAARWLRRCRSSRAAAPTPAHRARRRERRHRSATAGCWPFSTATRCHSIEMRENQLVEVRLSADVIAGVAAPAVTDVFDRHSRRRAQGLAVPATSCIPDVVEPKQPVSRFAANLNLGRSRISPNHQLRAGKLGCAERAVGSQPDTLPPGRIRLLEDKTHLARLER
jgi:hypothetical protein